MFSHASVLTLESLVGCLSSGEASPLKKFHENDHDRKHTYLHEVTDLT